MARSMQGMFRERNIQKQAEIKEVQMEVKDIAEYEEGDSQLAKYTIQKLHSIIDEIRKYIEENEEEGTELVWLYKNGSYYKAGILEILDKENE